jgi:hypothetical protein
VAAAAEHSSQDALCGVRARRSAKLALSGLSIAGSLILLIAAVFGSRAEAHLPPTVTYFYVYSSSTCSKQTEPLNVLFTTHANAARSVNHVQKHTGWIAPSGSGANTRYLRGHDYSCLAQNWQRATGSDADHWHIRGRTLHKDYKADITTIASAHREVVRACGHAVKPASGGTPSGFDTGREQVYTKFGGLAGLADHTGPATLNWGNTKNFLQCDGAYAASNGKVYSIKIPSTVHALP